MHILYEYECKCGEIYEVCQQIMEEKLDSFYCPKCNKIMPMKRLIGSSGFVLKGHGWEFDGYQKESNND